MIPKINCRYCGHDNLGGSTRCEQCLHSLMESDLPKPIHDDSFQSLMMLAPVGNLLTGEDLLVAGADDKIETVVRVFQEKNKNCILVYEGKKLTGIISYRDLLRKVVLKHPDLSKVTVREVMTPNPEYVKAEHPIAYAVNKMAMGGFRHLPVLADDGTPLSIISIQDVLGYLAQREQK